jgi:Glycolipid transfer protein (GLTP)
VNDLIQASNEYDTLQSIIDNDLKHNTVRHKGSHSRNLRRVRLGLDLIRALFEQFLVTKYVFLSLLLSPVHKHTTSETQLQYDFDHVLVVSWKFLVP